MLSRCGLASCFINLSHYTVSFINLSPFLSDYLGLGGYSNSDNSFRCRVLIRCEFLRADEQLDMMRTNQFTRSTKEGKRSARIIAHKKTCLHPLNLPPLTDPDTTDKQVIPPESHSFFSLFFIPSLPIKMFAQRSSRNPLRTPVISSMSSS